MESSRLRSGYVTNLHIPCTGVAQSQNLADTSLGVGDEKANLWMQIASLNSPRDVGLDMNDLQCKTVEAVRECKLQSQRTYLRTLPKSYELLLFKDVKVIDCDTCVRRVVYP
ncbi:MAG: hypothetical protein JJ992_10890 [Planctomycetes bacterium]|nr:hypothetical protein [Planctomycetota bacterium]